jgi:hypothetical protein
VNVTGNVAFGVTDVGVADLSFSITANTSVSAVVKTIKEVTMNYVIPNLVAVSMAAKRVRGRGRGKRSQCSWEDGSTRQRQTRACGYKGQGPNGSHRVVWIAC